MEKRIEWVIARTARADGGKETPRCVVIQLYCAVNISLDDIRQLHETMNGPDITFCEYGQKEIQEPFMPFLGIVREYLKDMEPEELERVFDECDLYGSHRPVFRSYLQNGRAERGEDLLIDETQFERRRMMDAMYNLTVWCSRQRPFMLVLNGFQQVGVNSLQIVRRLMESEESHRIHMVILYDVLQSPAPYVREAWDSWVESIEVSGRILEFEGLDKRSQVEEAGEFAISGADMDVLIRRLYNLVGMLDLEQAEYYLELLNSRLNIERSDVPERYKLWILILYIYVMICLGNYSRALLLCELLDGFANPEVKIRRYYLSALAYIYSGQLGRALTCLERCEALGEPGSGESAFRIRLLALQARMGGWVGMNYPMRDMAVEESMLRELRKRRFYNHLSYIWIYSRDNDVDRVIRSAEDARALPQFFKGVEWAKRAGNDVLVRKAYFRNLIIAATHGYYHVSNYYHFKSYRDVQAEDILAQVQACNGIGYNYCMMGASGYAQAGFVRALQLECRAGGRAAGRAAGTYYYMGLNALTKREFDGALEYMGRSLRIMRRLGLYGHRFCDLSQFYSIMSLCSAYGRDFANARVYLLRAEQFLKGLYADATPEGMLPERRAVIHGDLFLYSYALGLCAMQEGDYEKALLSMEEAEVHYGKARQDQRICAIYYRRDRQELFIRTGHMERAQLERERRELEEAQTVRRRFEETENCNIPALLGLEEIPDEGVLRELDREVELIVKRWEHECRYRRQKSNRDFLAKWLRILSNVDDIRKKKHIRMVMNLFKSYFNIDKVVFMRFLGEGSVYYSDLDTAPGREQIGDVQNFFTRRQQGFTVSRFNGHLSQYRQVIGLFEEDRLCSAVGVPVFNNNRLECAVIAVINTQDNCYREEVSCVIGEEELDSIGMMFYQLNSVICRCEKDEELRRIQEELRQAATTDQLTGILNREGFYRRLRSLLAGERRRMGVLFIDLDNFKNCNDRYGHRVGDMVLREIACVFAKVCGEGQFAVRFGGDEFVICALNADSGQLEALANQIYGELAGREYFLPTIKRMVPGYRPDLRDNISCSIGIACGEVATVQEVNGLLMCADQLLYEAKKGSKGVYFISRG